MSIMLLFVEDVVLPITITAGVAALVYCYFKSGISSDEDDPTSKQTIELVEKIVIKG